MASVSPNATVQRQGSEPSELTELPSSSSSSHAQEAVPTSSQTPPRFLSHDHDADAVSLTHSTSGDPRSRAHLEHHHDPQVATSLAVSSSADGEIFEPQKCWICFSDETEDGPLSSEWRSPCPCALTAHESCLLDWIADLQAPNNRKRTDASGGIRCPQCKSLIVIARPRNYIVDAVNAVERTARTLVVPGIIFVAAGCLWSGFMVHGLSTISVLFGREETDTILKAELLPANSTWTRIIPSDILIMGRLLDPTRVAHQGWSWRLGLGLPLIPVILILSRTTLADGVLPILPIVFFATHRDGREQLDLAHWPPSASMTLAALPYLRGVYNELFERAFGEKLRRWAREIQPRSGAAGREGHDGDEEDEAGEGQPVDDMGDGDLVMAINLEVDILEEGDAENEAHDHPRPAPNMPPHEQARDGPVPPAEDGAPAAQPQQHHVQHANNVLISTGQIARKIVGALVFPLISSAMGTFLKHILPESWTTSSAGWGRRPGGLLQTRWGRNIVGGCLFVVLKDALIVYARWKQAQTHRHRRVLDFDKKRKVYSLRGG